MIKLIILKITPKKPTPNINERNLPQQLKEVFPNVNEVTKQDSNDGFKEKIKDLDEVFDKIGKVDVQKNQKLFELEFFTGGKNPKFEKYIISFGLPSDNQKF